MSYSNLAKARQESSKNTGGQAPAKALYPTGNQADDTATAAAAHAPPSQWEREKRVRAEAARMRRNREMRRKQAETAEIQMREKRLKRQHERKARCVSYARSQLRARNEKGESNIEHGLTQLDWKQQQKGEQSVSQHAQNHHLNGKSRSRRRHWGEADPSANDEGHHTHSVPPTAVPGIAPPLQQSTLRSLNGGLPLTTTQSASTSPQGGEPCGEKEVEVYQCPAPIAEVDLDAIRERWSLPKPKNVASSKDSSAELAEARNRLEVLRARMKQSQSQRKAAISNVLEGSLTSPEPKQPELPEGGQNKKHSSELLEEHYQELSSSAATGQDRTNKAWDGESYHDAESEAEEIEEDVEEGAISEPDSLDEGSNKIEEREEDGARMWAKTLQHPASNVFDSLNLSLSREQKETAYEGQYTVARSVAESRSRDASRGRKANYDVSAVEERSVQSAFETRANSKTMARTLHRTSRYPTSARHLDALAEDRGRVAPSEADSAVGSIAASHFSLMSADGYMAAIARRQQAIQHQRSRSRRISRHSGSISELTSTCASNRAAWGKGEETEEQKRRRLMREKAASYSKTVTKTLSRPPRRHVPRIHSTNIWPLEMRENPRAPPLPCENEGNALSNVGEGGGGPRNPRAAPTKEGMRRSTLTHENTDLNVALGPSIAHQVRNRESSSHPSSEIQHIYENSVPLPRHSAEPEATPAKSSVYVSAIETGVSMEENQLMASLARLDNLLLHDASKIPTGNGGTDPPTSSRQKAHAVVSPFDASSQRLQRGTSVPVATTMAPVYRLQEPNQVNQAQMHRAGDVVHQTVASHVLFS